MEREITREHSGQKEDSLETKSPQAKVISNAHISQHVDGVAEIMAVMWLLASLAGWDPHRYFNPDPSWGVS